MAMKPEDRRAAEKELLQYIAKLQQAHLLSRAHFLVRDVHDRIRFWSKGAELLRLERGRHAGQALP